MNTKIIKIITVGMICIAFLGCGKETANSGNTNSNSTADGAELSKNINANLNENSNSNSNLKTAENNSPKRISFNKGANWGAVNITLAAGGTQKFIVGAKSGQTMDVEASSKEVSINLIKGKAETTEDFGFLNAALESNGDYIFEVKNSSKKEIKTSVKVTIKGENVRNNEINEGDSTAADDESDPAPRNTQEN